MYVRERNPTVRSRMGADSLLVNSIRQAGALPTPRLPQTVTLT
jgi:hypothetical protein